MDVLQVTALVLVAAMATGVVLTRVPVRQVVALSVYGLLLAVLFLAFQAPDVTLSELTVGAVALPILLMLALAKVREREQMSAAPALVDLPRRGGGPGGLLPVGPGRAARLRELPGPVRRHHQPDRGRPDQRHRCRVGGELRVPGIRHRRRGVHSVHRGNWRQHGAARAARGAGGPGGCAGSWIAASRARPTRSGRPP